MTINLNGNSIKVVFELCEDESCIFQHEKNHTEKFFRCKRLDE